MSSAPGTPCELLFCSQVDAGLVDLVAQLALGPLEVVGLALELTV